MAIALSSPTVTPILKLSPSSKLFHSPSPSPSPFLQFPSNFNLNAPISDKWRLRISFFPAFLNKGKKDVNSIKEELFQAIEPLDRGAEATPEDQQLVDQISRKLEAANPIKEPLKSNLLNGKWELIYTTSRSILQIEVTANLTPLNTRKVAVQFDTFKILGLIPVKAPGRARGELEITYLDEELRISRGDKGNLFILKMIDPSYRVPV